MHDFHDVYTVARAAILEPDACWSKEKSALRPSMEMAKFLTIPLVVASVIVGLILGLIFMGHYVSVGFIAVQAILNSVFGIGGIFLVALLADFFAGLFGGSRDYDKAFNAVALAGVPAALTSAVAPVPVLGWLAALALGLYSLILLYRVIPVFLTVPDDQRAVHYLATLGSALAIFFVFSVLSGSLWRH